MLNQTRSLIADDMTGSFDGVRPRKSAVAEGDASGGLAGYHDVPLEPDRSCPVCGGRKISEHCNNLSHCLICHHIFQSDLHATMVYNPDYARRYDQRPHRAMSALRWNFTQ